MNQTRTESELIQDFLSGNQSSIEILINKHRKKVYTYILFNVKEVHLAEDIFQDTFIKVIHSLKKGKYKDNGKLISWIMRIAHNLIIDHYRKRKQLNTVSNDNYETDLFNTQKFSEKTIEDTIINTQTTKDIRNLIHELPQDQKEVIILRHYCELSFKEIAEHTNVSINTALGRMRYALINLRKLIEERELNLVLV